MTLASLLAQPLIWAPALLALGFIAAMAGGALSGLMIAGRQLGSEVATQIGALFGLIAGVPGITAALIALALAG
jgi:hypothetical protein